MDSLYDVIVVGAGAVGSAAAYHAAKAGQRVLLLEQFEIDHGRGSSHGASRIIRYAYDHPTYIALARVAFAAWSALEAEADDELFVRTGGVDVGRRGEPSFENTIQALTTTGIPFRLLNAADAKALYPQFTLDDDMFMLYQADAGALRASRCVLAHVRLARKYGADILENTTVISASVEGETVQVETDRGTFSAAKLILAAGAWQNQVLESLGVHLPLTPVKCQENYFEADVPEDFEVGKFPIFLAHLPEGYGVMPYGLPSLDGSGFKIGLHGGPPFDPNDSDRTPDISVHEKLRHFMSDYLPGANGLLVHSRVCLYTMTPDEHFVLDLHPQYRNVVIASCCSGHAFKFSTVLGKIAADLALTGETEHDIDLFRMDRFTEAPANI